MGGVHFKTVSKEVQNRWEVCYVSSFFHVSSSMFKYCLLFPSTVFPSILCIFFFEVQRDTNPTAKHRGRKYTYWRSGADDSSWMYHGPWCIPTSCFWCFVCNNIVPPYIWYILCCLMIQVTSVNEHSPRYVSYILKFLTCQPLIDHRSSLPP